MSTTWGELATRLALSGRTELKRVLRGTALGKTAVALGPDGKPTAEVLAWLDKKLSKPREVFDALEEMNLAERFNAPLSPMPVEIQAKTWAEEVESTLVPQSSQVKTEGVLETSSPLIPDDASFPPLGDKIGKASAPNPAAAGETAPHPASWYHKQKPVTRPTAHYLPPVLNKDNLVSAATRELSATKTLKGTALRSAEVSKLKWRESMVVYVPPVLRDTKAGREIRVPATYYALESIQPGHLKHFVTKGWMDNGDALVMRPFARGPQADSYDPVAIEGKLQNFPTIRLRSYSWDATTLYRECAIAEARYIIFRLAKVMTSDHEPKYFNKLNKEFENVHVGGCGVANAVLKLAISFKSLERRECKEEHFENTWVSYNKGLLRTRKKHQTASQYLAYAQEKVFMWQGLWADEAISLYSDVWSRRETTFHSMRSMPHMKGDVTPKAKAKEVEVKKPSVSAKGKAKTPRSPSPPPLAGSSTGKSVYKTPLQSPSLEDFKFVDQLIAERDARAATGNYNQVETAPPSPIVPANPPLSPSKPAIIEAMESTDKLVADANGDQNGARQDTLWDNIDLFDARSEPGSPVVPPWNEQSHNPEPWSALGIFEDSRAAIKRMYENVESRLVSSDLRLAIRLEMYNAMNYRDPAFMAAKAVWNRVPALVDPNLVGIAWTYVSGGRNKEINPVRPRPNDPQPIPQLPFWARVRKVLSPVTWPIQRHLMRWDAFFAYRALVAHGMTHVDAIDKVCENHPKLSKPEIIKLANSVWAIFKS